MPPVSDDALHAAESIDQVVRPLAEWTLERLGPAAPARAVVTGILRHTAEAVSVACPAVLVESLRWNVLHAEDRDRYHGLLTAVRATTDAHLPPAVAERARACLDAALAALPDLDPAPRTLAESNPLAMRYLALGLEGKVAEATDLVMQEAENGRPVSELMLDILVPAQVAVGDLWHRGEVSIAEEHLVTATSTSIVAMLRHFTRTVARIDRRVVLATVGSELHDVGLRIVAEFFRMAGWWTLCPGSNLPVDEALRFARASTPDVIGLSAGSLLTLRPLRLLLLRLRDEDFGAELPVVVGGFPFSRIPELARHMGADAAAASAPDAVAAATRLVDARANAST